MNITSTQQTSAIIESINQQQTTFAYYDTEQGTKYKKCNCALLIAGTGTLGGLAVTALVDPATRNDILKGVGVGMASSILYLWGSVKSLKPVTEYGISQIQSQIRHRLHSNLIVQTNNHKTMEELKKDLEHIKPKAVAEQQELAEKAQKHYDIALENFKQKFSELSAGIGSYLAIRGFATAVYNDYPPPGNAHTTNTNNNARNSNNNKENKYTKATLAFFTFIQEGSNDFFSKHTLLKSLQPCLTESEIVFITSYLDSYPTLPRKQKFTGPNEIVYTDLQHKYNRLSYKQEDIKTKIEKLQKQHGIEINEDGKIIFPNLGEFLTSLPK